MRIKIKGMTFETYEKREEFCKRLARMFTRGEEFQPYTVDQTQGLDWRVEWGNDWFISFPSASVVSITTRLRKSPDELAMAAWLNVVFSGSVTVF